MRVAVVGTGTGVGKTYVSCALARALASQGVSCRALKPIESGLGAQGVPADAVALAEAAGHAVVRPLHAFERPVSPHLEARRLGVKVKCDAVAAWVQDHGGDVTLVETAGGVLSPLGVDVTNLDLLAWLEVDRVVVVAPDRLGVLHDVAAVRWVLDATGWWRSASVVLSCGAASDASTGTNAAELGRLGLAENVVVVGRDGAFARDELAAVAPGFVGLVGGSGC